MKLLLSTLLLILHTACVFAAFNAQDIIRFRDTLTSCKNQHAVDSSVLDRVMEGQQVDDENFNCFAACLLEGLGLLKPDNSLNTELAISKLPEDAEFTRPVKEAIEKCGARRDDDKCKTAHLLFMCMHENNIPQVLMG